MGNNIRIGKDFKVLWTINKVVDGERLPYSLVGKELQLCIVNDNGRKEVAGWKVRGNVIEWTFLGKDQKRLGAYQLVLVENADKDGMVTVDTCKAFNLVAHSCEEDVEGGNGIVIETVTLESDVALAPVVKEIGGESYDDTELRNAIADLQTKDMQTDAKLTELSAEVNEVAEKIDNINPTPMVSVTYAELVELRDNGELIAGMQYRIIDFVTTTAQENTRSAGHQFDVIVTADNENTLNEVARACRSDFNIEKYKDAFSESWGEKMLFVGTQEYEGKEYHLYESESQNLQMLVDFFQIKSHLYAQSAHYPYHCFPSFARAYDGSIWEDWQLGVEYGDVIQFKYDTPAYFATSKLEAWQIWYSLDNDVEKFAWATVDAAMKVYDAEDDSSLIYKRHKLHDTNLFAWAKVIHSEDSEFGGVIDWDNLDDSDLIFTESENIALGSTLIRQGGISVKVVDIQYGKGVIYRMIDEWNNDCPYDFKNILFKRNLNFDEGLAQFSEDGEETWVYTFTGQSYHINNEAWSDMLDGSLESPFGHMSDDDTSTFHDNTIKPYIMLYNGNDIYTECGIRYLNDIVFLGYWQKIGSANDEDIPYYYAFCCCSNSFGNNCYSNSFGYNCCRNTFGNNCHHNTFGNDCSDNSFGYNCSNNSLGVGCRYNSFGYNCGPEDLNEGVVYKTVSVNSNGEVKVFNIADLADLLNN